MLAYTHVPFPTVLDRLHLITILFYIGGVAPIVFAIIAIFALPESIKYMTLHERHRSKMVALLAAMTALFLGVGGVLVRRAWRR